MRVLIIGGGVAGHLIAYALQDRTEVTLVEPRPHFTVPIALPRLLVEPELAARTFIPYSEFLPKVHHIQGRATSLDAGSCTIACAGESITVTADVVVIATGAGYANDWFLFPPSVSTAERIEQAHATANRIQAANHIVVQGGGAIGVEVAAELISAHPNKELVLIEAGPTLLPGAPPRAGTLARQWLERRGVGVRTNTVADFHPTDEHAEVGLLNSGETIATNIVFRCFGYRPNLSFLQFPESVTDTAGQITVDDHLRLTHHDHIFACGDITALPERKMAMYAAKHANTISRNILAMRDGQPPSATYRPATGDQTMLTTLGPTDGICTLPLGTYRIPWLARMLKSSDLMVTKYRKRIGLVR